MPSSGRHILDIKKKGPSRAHARAQMTQLFTAAPKRQKPQRLRDKRRKARIMLGALAGLATLALIGALAGATHLEQFAIKDIAISGTRELSSEALAASAAAAMQDDGFRLFSRENMFLYPRRATEEALANEFPRIKSVSLSRESLFAQAVTVAVEERVPYAKWCAQGGTCYLLDNTGFIFAEAPERGASFDTEPSDGPVLPYVFYGGLALDREPVGQWFLRGRLSSVVALLDAFAQADYAAAEFSVDSEKDFTIRLAKGPKLLMSFDVNELTALRNLQTALGAEGLRERFESLQYVDLRFGNRVYYK